MYCSNCGKELVDGAKFCPECGHPVAINTVSDKQLNNDEKQEQDKNVEETKQPKKNTFNGIGVLIFFIILVVYSFYTSNATAPRDPQKLECINYKNLCIATTNVKYDYTAVKTRTPGYPTYNKEWNNGWASAQKACEAWGGRLPYMEEFATIVDAYNNHKIKLEDYKDYLSSTQINTYRIWAYSHRNDFARKGYNSKSIYDAAISIEKSGDWVITGDYGTNTAYTWNARCVKDIDASKTIPDKKSKEQVSQKTKSNTLQQNYESSKTIKLSKELIQEDIQGYYNYKNSLYGAAINALEDFEKSNDPNREINILYTKKFINNIECLSRRFDASYCGIQKIIVYDEDYTKLSDLTKLLIKILNSMVE